MTEHWYRPDGSGPITVGQFIAEGHKFGREASVAQWEEQVGDTPVHISTVFLGLDHSFGTDDGRPKIYESMVFGGTFDSSIRRYATPEQAQAGHSELVAIVMLDANYAHNREAPTS